MTTSKKIQQLLKKSTARGKAKGSLINIIKSGSDLTGSSGYSKGWANKSIWTSETSAACREIGLAIICGNNAPRGGANGEYVMLVQDRRKNQLIHRYQELIARNNKIESARFSRINRIEAEKNAAKIASFNLEFEKYIPFIESNEERFTAVNNLSKAEKNIAVIELLRECLQSAGGGKSVDFYGIFKKAIASIYSKKEMAIAAEIELKKQACLTSGERFITREEFHLKTKACYLGIDSFLKTKFGAVIEGLPLSEAIAIIPKQYAEKL